MQDFATLLQGGDRRSIGKVPAVMAAIADAPQRFVDLWACVRSTEAIVRMRALDAVEKITRTQPDILMPFKQDILSGVCDDGTSEVRWHLAALMSRLPLTDEEAQRVFAQLQARVMQNGSRIVRVMALQAAFDLSRAHPALETTARELIEHTVLDGPPSLRARARKLAATAARGAASADAPSHPTNAG